VGDDGGILEKGKGEVNIVLRRSYRIFLLLVLSLSSRVSVGVKKIKKISTSFVQAEVLIT